MYESDAQTYESASWGALGGILGAGCRCALLAVGSEHFALISWGPAKGGDIIKRRWQRALF